MTRYPPEALRAVLARHMLFREATPTLLDGLVKFATVRHFQPNDEIFAKGEEAILNILEPGEIFGEIALLDGGSRTASARAMKAVDLLQIHRDHFVPFLHDHPELGVAILPVLCGRIRMNVEFIE